MTDILDEAEELFDDCKTGWGDIYEGGKEDVRFAAGEQWDDTEKNGRRDSNRPCLTINLLPQHIHQVSNDIRMNTPSINVIPEDDEANEEDAQAIKEWIRGIEYKSKADAAYDTAVDCAIRGRIGWLRVDHDYTDESGFEQDIKILRVPNPYAVWIDPSITECDGSDAMFGFVIDEYSKREFKKKWPGKNPVSFGRETRADDKTVQVAEFFQIEESSKPAALMADGSEVEYSDDMKESPDLKAVRNIKARTVKRYKLSGDDILEETTFPGCYVPLVPVFGEEQWIDGKRTLKSLVTNAKDPQRLYNLWKSYEAEVLQKSPIAPVMAAEGQTEDYAAQWKNPHSTNVLRYKTTDVNGQPVGPPQRLQPASIPTGLVNASMIAKDDIKGSTGIYDASLGARSNEQSGKAITARQKEGDVSNFHYGDNLDRAIAQLGRIIVGMRSEVIDTERTLMGVGVDDKPTAFGVNGKIVNKQKQTHDFTKGKYGVRVSTGASFSTKKQEAASFLENVVSRDPNLMMIAGDLLFKAMDIPGAEALSERMKLMLPPQIKQAEDAKEAGQEIDPEKMAMQQTLEKSMAYAQQLEQQLQIATQQLQNTEIQNQLNQQKMANEKAKLDLEMEKTQVEAYRAESEAAASGVSQDVLPATAQRAEALRAQKEQELQVNVAIAQELMGAINNLNQTLAAGIVSVNQPKQVLRDETGRIVGVQ